MKKSQLERKTARLAINSNPLSFTNLLSKANPENRTEERKSDPKKAQPYRLSD